LALAEVQEQKIIRIMAENDKLIKERSLFTKEILKMENLMEVITKPVSSDVKNIENLSKEDNIETFKTL